MKIAKTMIYKSIVVAFTLCLSITISFAQDLRLTNQRGVEFKSKPSLSQRMQGVRKIYLFYPRSTAQNDRYVYQNFKVYLQRLGLTVDDRAVSYKSVEASQGTVSAYILSCTEDVSEYVKEMNSLAVVLNIGHMYGQYTGERMTAAFNFVDFFNGYDWQVKIEPAYRAERFISQCQSSICSSYSYNSSYAYQPPFITSNYTQYMLRSYIDKGEYSVIEGIYEGDDYTLGVKKGTDGKYYLIYHGSKRGADGWGDGYIKAVLRETATSGVYRATWYGRYFQQMDYKIIFEKGMFTAYDEDNDKDFFLKMYPTSQMESERSSPSGEWSGTGFALKNGYIVTNYHVVDGAKSIEVHGVNGNASSNYTASVVATDKTNDLAIIHITDSRFIGFGNIPYAIKSQMVDVGEDVWVLGYPLTQVLGNEIKLTNGVVSSRSGYQGDVSTYQISAPVQPGNSGGPLFDAKGNIVGIVNAGVPGAENVGYAIKTSYLKNLVDSYSLAAYLPTNNTISSMPLRDQVKNVNDFVFLLICSSKAKASYSSSSTTRSSSASSSGSSYSSSSGYSGSSSSSSSSLSSIGSGVSSSRFETSTSTSQPRMETSKVFMMKVNEKVQLKISGKTVTGCESDNTKVLIVNSDGVVTGISSGKTNVWAYLSGGDVQLFTIRVVK